MTVQEVTLSASTHKPPNAANGALPLETVNRLTQDELTRARGALRSAMLFADAVGARRLNAQAADGLAALGGSI